MAFLDALFGKKKPEKIELLLEEISGFVEKNTASKKNDIEKAVASKFSEIRHVLGETEKEISVLKAGQVESSNARLKKIVGTSKQQAISKLSSLLQKIQPPNTLDIDSAKKYSVEAKTILTREIWKSGKSIAYTGISLKESIKQLGVNFKELETRLSELDSLLKNADVIFSGQKAIEQASLIEEKKKLIESLKNEILQNGAGLAGEKHDRIDLEKELDKVKHSDEFNNLKSLESDKAELIRKKQGKKTELVSLLASIDKPLKRFSKAVSGGRIILPSQLRDSLLQLEENPLMLLKKDPKGEIVKVLLLELKQAILSGSIELKEKEREKRLLAIDELLAFNFFSKVFWEFNEIDSQLQALEKKIKESGAISRMFSVESQISEQKKSQENAVSKLDETKKRLEIEQAEFEKIRLYAEELLGKISGQKVELK